MKRLVALLMLSVLLFGIAAGEEIRYQDGVYRGFYYQDGMEQVAVQFELKDGIFKSVILRNLKNHGGSFITEQDSDWQRIILAHCNALCAYLTGKRPEAINDLYFPQDILAAAGYTASPHISYSKLISALWDALNRHPFKLVDTSKLPEADPYPDGTYTGSYCDDDGEQVILELTLKDNVIENIQYRKLEYKGVNYMHDAVSKELREVAGQFQALIDYLAGKDVSAVNDLYLPGTIAEDTDVYSAATLRSPKVISAIWDGLNKNTYHID